MRTHTALAVEEAAVVKLWATEQRHLPPTYLKRSQANFDQYIDTWATTLREFRPELSTDDAVVLSAAIIGMINQSAIALAGVKPEERRRVVYAAAVHALRAPLDVAEDD